MHSLVSIYTKGTKSSNTLQPAQDTTDDDTTLTLHLLLQLHPPGRQHWSWRCWKGKTDSSSVLPCQRWKENDNIGCSAYVWTFGPSQNSDMVVRGHHGRGVVSLLCLCYVSWMQKGETIGARFKSIKSWTKSYYLWRVLITISCLMQKSFFHLVGSREW